MITILFEKDVAAYIIVVLFAIGVICKCIMEISLLRIIKESENMNNSKNNFLKQIKLKYENCYRLNIQVNNVSVFIKKFVYKYKLLGISIKKVSSLSKICNLLCVTLGVLSGLAIYMLFHNLDKVILYVLGGVILSICGVILENIVDAESKIEMLHTNIKDYLENSLKNKLVKETFKNEHRFIAVQDADTQMHIPLVKDEMLFDKKKVFEPLNDLGIKNQIVDNSVIEEILKEYLA